MYPNKHQNQKFKNKKTKTKINEKGWIELWKEMEETGKKSQIKNKY